MMTRFFSALVLLLTVAASAANGEPVTATLPPGALPVPVSIGLYLIELLNVNDESETFEADLNVRMRWKDERLAFVPSENSERYRLYLDADADERLAQIWHPEVELVNASTPSVIKRAVLVYDDGTVENRFALSALFRTPLDLRQFPFDRQFLEVRLRSFVWDDKDLVFVPDAAETGFSDEASLDSLSIVKVTSTTRLSRIKGFGEGFSDLVFLVEVQRHVGFYIWTVFVPICITVLISCAVFFVPIEELAPRVDISITCLLACIAIQFAISLSMPKIPYLKPIDRLFIVAYACVGMGVLLSVIQGVLWHHRSRRARWLDWIGVVGVPLIFALSLYFFILY